ncbi:MAG: hypothetical protein V5A15_06515 [Haloarcula sp.]
MGSVPRQVYLVVLVPALLGAAHHVDHIVRGNHVGWPLTAEVNAFTLSLAVYPLLAFGLVLTMTGRAGLRYWLGFLTANSVLLAFVHLGPWAIEPPSDIITPYSDPIVGYGAFGVVLALIAAVAIGAAYTAVLSVRGGQ